MLKKKGCLFIILLDLVLLLLSVGIWFAVSDTFEKKQTPKEISFLGISPREGNEEILKALKRKGYPIFQARLDPDMRFTAGKLFGLDMAIIATDRKLSKPALIILPQPTQMNAREQSRESCQMITDAVSRKYGKEWISYGPKESYRLWLYQAPQDHQTLKVSALIVATPEIEQGLCYPYVIYSYFDLNELLEIDLSIESKKRVLSLLSIAEEHIHVSQIMGDDLIQNFEQATMMLREGFSITAWQAMKKNSFPYKSSN